MPETPPPEGPLHLSPQELATKYPDALIRICDFLDGPDGNKMWRCIEYHRRILPMHDPKPTLESMAIEGARMQGYDRNFQALHNIRSFRGMSADQIAALTQDHFPDLNEPTGFEQD